MLSYQHEYHIGNFADLHKHLVLFAVLEALSNKPKPWTAVDLYAGSGVYRLAGHSGIGPVADEAWAKRWPDAPAVAGDEWRTGYGCLHGRPPTSPLLMRFCDALAAYAGVGIGEPSSHPLAAGLDWQVLPGSPAWIVQAMRRGSAVQQSAASDQTLERGVPRNSAPSDPAPPDPAPRNPSIDDRAIFCERHPKAYAALRRWTRSQGPGSATGIAVHRRDAGEAAVALLPPPVRRGLVLIDPPYERLSEYNDVAHQVATARRRWPEATVLLWSPRLGDRARDHAAVGLVGRVLTEGRRGIRQAAGATAIWSSELRIEAESGLIGSTMTVLSAPYRIEESLMPALSELVLRLRQDDCGGRVAVHEWRAGPQMGVSSP